VSAETGAETLGAGRPGGMRHAAISGKEPRFPASAIDTPPSA
jgi:hypothetical protein